MSATTTSKKNKKTNKKKNAMKKTCQLNLAHKSMELSEIFWKKINFEAKYISRSFDISRADIRKILN